MRWRIWRKTACLLLVLVIIDSSLTVNGKTRTQAVSVVYNVPSEIYVIIPKTISLVKMDDKLSGTYVIDCSNSKLAIDETIVVKPSDSFVLKDKYKSDTINVDVKQNETNFCEKNVMSATGTLSADATNISAGTWTGKMLFTIKLEKDY